MAFSPWSLEMSFILFVGMIGCLEAGYRLGQRQIATGRYRNLGAVETAIFALLGLLLGFAFAGATSRFDARRDLVVKEANAIGTAYLRLDLLPPADQLELRRLFRAYLDARVSIYDNAGDPDTVAGLVAKVNQLQQSIWAGAVRAAGRDGTSQTPLLVLPALNDMIDVTTSRAVMASTRLPALILALLMIVSMLSALLAGLGMAERGRSWLHVLLYAAAVTITIYTVLDLDNPRAGLIRLDAADQVLKDLLQSMP
jgi:hypothetical protein